MGKRKADSEMEFYADKRNPAWPADKYRPLFRFFGGILIYESLEKLYSGNAGSFTKTKIGFRHICLPPFQTLRLGQTHR